MLLALMVSVMTARSCVCVGSAALWLRTYLRRNNIHNTLTRPSSVFELRNNFRFRAPLTIYVPSVFCACVCVGGGCGRCNSKLWGIIMPQVLSYLHHLNVRGICPLFTQEG